MPVTLEQIVAVTRKKIIGWKRTVDERELERLAETRTPRRFQEALLRAGARGPAIIAELKKAYAFEVEIVKKTSLGLLERMSLPKFPAVEIDGTVVFEGCDVSRDQLAEAIKARQR